MTMTTDNAAKLLRSRYDKAGQGHVFQHFDTLAENEQKEFLAQLEGVQVEQLAALLTAAQTLPTPDGSTIQPFAGTVGRPSMDDACYQKGMAAIRDGQVAALVLAGGQGTRLGFSGPKGCFDIGLRSQSTLFQLMAERIRKLQSMCACGATTAETTTTERSAVTLPFYIMTSPINHDETVAFFERQDYFGLGQRNVFFFPQGMLPCMDNEGKIILESRTKIAMAPDGNGGIYPSLHSSGALQDMKDRGVQYLHVFSIDNALVKPADPLFIGYCIDQDADCGNKVVWKANAHEKVGVIASREGKPCIVEYSEITTEMAEKQHDGRLVYGAGNICNHFYTLAFVSDVILPNMSDLYHIAHKKIPFFDTETQQTVTPSTNNGIKLETFIFDVFPLSQKMAVLDVKRKEEFAPVKNASGNDSPETAKEMISTLAKDWIFKAGGKLTGNASSLCEISPLTSYAGEDLKEIAEGKDIECPFTL